MNIVIVGSGAIGAFVATHWAKASINLRLLGRPSFAEALATSGLRLSGGGDLSVTADSLIVETDPICLSDADVIILAVKSTGLGQAIEEIRKNSKKGCAVVSLLNGLAPMRALESGLNGFELMAGMVPFNVVWESDNHLHRSSVGNIALQRGDVTENLALAVAETACPITLHDDLKPIQHGKLLLNLMNPINALSGLPLHAQLSQRPYRAVYAAALDEAREVYTANNIEFVKAGPFPPHITTRLVKWPNIIFNNTILRIQNIDKGSRTSMAADFTAQKPTEIDTINGEILHLAKQAGVVAPINAKLVELIKQAPENGWKTYSGQELCADLGL